jgi:hypothetical protein
MVLLGSFIARPLSAPWAQELFTRMIGFSILIDLLLQSVPQVKQ